jgi:hypothetical protein
MPCSDHAVLLKIKLERHILNPYQYGMAGERQGRGMLCVNPPLNAELNPSCHFLALLVAHHILHVSKIRVKIEKPDNVRINVTPRRVRLTIVVVGKQ